MNVDNYYNVLSLCSGVGGLDLGIRIAVPNARTVCYAEREAFCCEILATRGEQSSLDQSPVWTDLRTFDGKPWRGVVDCIVAGIPCQGNSLAGKRLLDADPRDLWPDTRRIIREVEPEWFFLENVAGFLVPGGGRTAPAARVLGELAEDWWDAEWCCISAASCGASHQRKRFFLLAHSLRNGEHRRDGKTRNGRRVRKAGGEVGNAACPTGTRQREPIPRQAISSMADSQSVNDGERQRQRIGTEIGTGAESGTEVGGGVVADATTAERRREDEGKREKRRDVAGGAIGGSGEQPLGDTTGRGSQGSLPIFGPDRSQDCERSGELAGDSPAVEHPRRPAWTRDGGGTESELSINRGTSGTLTFPPGPGDRDAWARIVADSPHLAPAIECPFRRVANGIADRPRVDVECGHEQEHGSETGTEIHIGTVLPAMRPESQEAGQASLRLQPSSGRGDSLPQVSSESGSGSGNTQEGRQEKLPDMRQGVSAKSQQARHALWLVGMQAAFRRLVGEKEMGWQEQDEVLRCLWERVSIQEAEREDLWDFLRLQAVVDVETMTAQTSRVDELRSLGNAVVPIQAAVAFTELVRRLKDDP